ncbi:MAG: molybdopterin-dependent oxidoreductase [Chloroflexi bacterium]|nr:molybdopterin-dependent oxidoreductase [Chloroflexota bacterium]
MTDNFSRRDFLKVVGTGAAATTVLTGCGPASRYVTREPYTKMPEYTYNGQSTYYATTCRECAAGCGLVVRTMQGRAIKVEGNKLNPLNLGKTCARGQASLHGLYNPDRIQNPGQHSRGEKTFSDMDWEAATALVAEALKGNPGELAFVMGLAPDHLFDLVSDLCQAIGAPQPVRYGALGMFEARATLGEASRAVFGKPNLLFFDLANADVTFSFGSNFLESWLSPVAYTRGFAKMRQGTNRRGYLVQFEARMSQTGMKSDEWIPIVPGTEGLVAAAIGRLAAEKKFGSAPAAFTKVDVAQTAELSGISLETLERLAAIFAGAEQPLAIPGGAALAQVNGLGVATAILGLNALINNLGKPGGVFLTPDAPLNGEYNAAATAQEMAALVEKMNSGAIKTLFVHGVNPVFELPAALGFEAALSKVKTVISFASFPDETALLADYVFPDHTALESFGYQRIPTGSGQALLSGAQPVVAPYYNTRATADLLLAAGALAGSKAALAFKDEVEFIQSKLVDLVSARDGYYSAADLPSFWVEFQQFGGWWQNGNTLGTPNNLAPWDKALELAPVSEGDGEFHLLAYPSPILAEAGANKPWLQEVPDPTTTVMWNSWVEINTKTAEELGIKDDDVVKVVSPFGTVEVSVLIYRAIRPDVVAIPFGQGHTAYGRYAEGRGVNPADLFGKTFNGAGDLAFAGMKVKIEKTGKKRPLSRMEGYTKFEQAEKKQ